MIASRRSSSLGLSSLYSQELSRRIGEALENKPGGGGKQLHNQLQDLIIQLLYFRKSAKFEIKLFLATRPERHTHGFNMLQENSSSLLPRR